MKPSGWGFEWSIKYSTSQRTERTVRYFRFSLRQKLREGEDDKEKISFIKEGDKNIRKHPRKGVMQFLKMLKKEVNQEHLNQKKKIL